MHGSQRYAEKGIHQGGSIMDIEQQIEDLCLDKAQQEATIYRVQLTNVFRASMEELASLKAEKQIARARIQAIDSQLEELRNKLAKNYKEDITTKQEANS